MGPPLTNQNVDCPITSHDSLVRPTILHSFLKHPVPLVLTLMIAGFLRISQLDFFGLSADEFATWMIISGHSFKSIVRTCFVVSQPVPPFYFLLCKPFADCWGTNEIGLRVLSVICSTLTDRRLGLQGGLS